MAETVESRVVALVAKECGQSVESLTLDDTLVEDLGMTGDDAVVFFEIFHTEFATDLNDLYQDWRTYFPPRRGSIWTGVVFAIPFMLLAFLLTQLVPRFPKYAAFLITFVLWIVLLAMWTRRRRNEARAQQITIQDLIDAAHAKRWTKSSAWTPESEQDTVEDEPAGSSDE